MNTKILFKIRSQPKVRSNSRAIKATQFGKQRLLYHTGIALNLGFILEVERMNVWKKNSTALSLEMVSLIIMYNVLDKSMLHYKKNKKCNHLTFLHSNVKKDHKMVIKIVF